MRTTPSQTKFPCKDTFGDPLDRNPEDVLVDVEDDYVSIERAVRDYGVVIEEIDPDLCEYEIDLEATERKREYIRENRKDWLSEDPKSVIKRYNEGELDMLDLIRRYGVILDWSSGDLLEQTTEDFREMLHDRAVSEWSYLTVCSRYTALSILGRVETRRVLVHLALVFQILRRS